MSNLLQIKKYPNRRYYDATRRRHITLHEVHDLVMAGHDVCVTDSKTGEDITNLILFQVLLEQDQPKLDLFPASILHMMIRANRQALHAAFEVFFGPFLRMVSSSQRQMDTYLRNTMTTPFASPLDWGNQLMRAFSGSQISDNGQEPPEDEPSPENQPPPSDDMLEQLRQQIATLSKQVENLSNRPADS